MCLIIKRKNDNVTTLVAERENNPPSVTELGEDSQMTVKMTNIRHPFYRIRLKAGIINRKEKHKAPTVETKLTHFT